MSNSMLKFKFVLKSKLGLIPGTSRLEARKNELDKEYEEFLNYEKSNEPKRFMELEEIVTSQDFEDRRKHINNQRFKGSPAWQKFRDYSSMKNSREFKGFFAIVKSKEFADYRKCENSDELKEFENLGTYLKTNEFKAVKSSKFKESEAWQKYLEYKRLSKKPEIRDYFRIKHSKNYKAFKEVEGSKTLAHFEELHQLVNSSEFLVMKRSMSASEFKQTNEFAKYKEYKSLESDPDIRGYNELLKDRAYSNFKVLANSPEIREFESLENYINSSEYKNARKDFELKKAAELHKLNDYNNLRKSVKFKSYYKIRNSRDLQYYKKLNDSPELERFYELEKYIGSTGFKESKSYLESRDKFKKSPEYAQLVAYEELKKSRKLKWYFKLKKSGKFEEVKKWKLVFSDDFAERELDKNKWLTSFYWGKELLKESYSLGSDPHFYTDGNNLEVENSMLKLHTRKELVTGQAWDPAIGFFPKEFAYTSGLVNTGDSFRQKYGAFEAKIRMHPSKAVNHAFWMLSDTSVPHIDIFRYSGLNKRQIELNNYWEQGQVPGEIRRNADNVGGIDFSKGFFIFRLEWYPDRLIWKINDTVVKIEEEGIPDVPMYLLLSSGVEDNADGNGLPSSLDIDWVKCYSLEKQA
jgi:beta-glucanase (GH16 family)